MTAADSLILASGKGHRDENFPVASFVLRPDLRGPVMAFYRFARAADDVADDGASAPEEKLRLLAQMRATLEYRSDADGPALALRLALEGRAVPLTHAHDLLTAFERDVIKLRTTDWDDLIDYCRYSAMPVGRFMLELHGETRDIWPLSDALCAALQIINHLQDCAKDRRNLDRVYLPLDCLARHGTTVEALDAPFASPGLLAAIEDLRKDAALLLDEAAAFSVAIRDRRLGMEVAMIDALARKLLELLKRRDPLSQRVHLGKLAAARIGLAAAIRRLVAAR
ncbi:squalene synthase HpnC [Novosphingobium sp.]|uniref:squalene synthase HpnC n=1 Tax=Novosphingobium sp. TaxID=1874826 RepID=UPI001DFD3B09|nr:squalene synthase HpnC [Novosphingobium sp.]MBX9664747.1 squalene synthase HpnC [Novosphingobium sp.]